MTARLISNPTIWRLHCSQGRRDAVCDWLKANGLDPLAVLSTHDAIVEDAPDGGQQIKCTVIEKDATHPVETTVPLVVPVPDGWPHYTAPGMPS
ncbi:hypothetical protein [Streptomyces spinosisporus]|uniref:DUF2007 domain-containing protein n=1 Tax=Streptomyces spinosisporus TaxID=2927582 RepID=A0ABS9XW83_9ACTN|nr:hypothetical protein [Streptomyces spinosisporus]MCI3246343.1 hypothetical protein [Streptomyces spinosisporus]